MIYSIYDKIRETCAKYKKEEAERRLQPKHEKDINYKMIAALCDIMHKVTMYEELDITYDG
jgi:hypothetical protein